MKRMRVRKKSVWSQLIQVVSFFRPLRKEIQQPSRKCPRKQQELLESGGKQVCSVLGARAVKALSL